MSSLGAHVGRGDNELAALLRSAARRGFNEAALLRRATPAPSSTRRRLRAPMQCSSRGGSASKKILSHGFEPWCHESKSCILTTGEEKGEGGAVKGRTSR